MKAFGSLLALLLALSLPSGAQATAAERAPAVFPVLPLPVTLTVTVAQGQGSVRSTPAGIDCSATCSATFAPGTTVQLVATSAAGSIAESWGGACASATGSTCTFSLVTSASAEVFFGRPVLSVTVQDLSSPPSPTARGWVTSFGLGEDGSTSPPDIDCGAACASAFDAGTVVTLWAIPFSGSVFEGWTGDCSGGSICVVTMDRARSVTARFDLPTGPTDIKSTFTVSKNGTGSGTVKSGLPGIDCGSDCGTRYPSNVNVTLTATAAEGSHLVGWSGPCAGVGTKPTCVVTVGPATGVTVTFDVNKSAPAPSPVPTAAPQEPTRPQEPADPQEPDAPGVKTITTGPTTLRILRSSRRVIQLKLTCRAPADSRMRLLRRGRVILGRRVQVDAGRRVLNVAVPKWVRRGHYRFELVLTDGAGRLQRLTWPVRL